MRTTHRKQVFTTGEVAAICHVAPRTVSKWFDTGKLRGYRIPGSRDRRIPVGQLIAFMRTHGIPLGGLDGGLCRILLVDGQGGPQFDRLVEGLCRIERYEVRTADNGFDAGVTAEQFRPHVVVLDADAGLQEAAAICEKIRGHSDLNGAKLIAVTTNLDEAARQALLAAGFDACLAKPCTIEQLAQAVENVTDLSA